MKREGFLERPLPLSQFLGLSVINAACRYQFRVLIVVLLTLPNVVVLNKWSPECRILLGYESNSRHHNRERGEGRRRRMGNGQGMMTLLSLSSPLVSETLF